MANRNGTNMTDNKEKRLITKQTELLRSYIDDSIQNTINNMNIAKDVIGDMLDRIPDTLKAAGVHIDEETVFIPSDEAIQFIHGQMDLPDDDETITMPAIHFMNKNDKYLYVISFEISLADKEEKYTENGIIEKNLVFESYISRLWLSYEEILNADRQWELNGESEYSQVFSKAMMDEITRRTAVGALAIECYQVMEQYVGESDIEFACRCEQNARGSSGLAKIIDKYPTDFIPEISAEGMIGLTSSLIDDGFMITYSNGEYTLYQVIEKETAALFSDYDIDGEYIYRVASTPSFAVVNSFVQKVISKCNTENDEDITILVPLSFKNFMVLSDRESMRQVLENVGKGYYTRNETMLLEQFLQTFFDDESQMELQEDDDEPTYTELEQKIVPYSRNKRLSNHHR